MLYAQMLKERIVHKSNVKRGLRRVQNQMLETRMMSAKTPAAVTAAPAP